MAKTADPFGARGILKTKPGRFTYWSLPALEKQGLAAISAMPFAIRVLLEQALRQVDGFQVREEDVRYPLPLAGEELPRSPLQAGPGGDAGLHGSAGHQDLESQRRSLVKPRQVTSSHINYDQILGPWEARGDQDLGLLGVSVPETFLVNTSTTTRLQVQPW